MANRNWLKGAAVVLIAVLALAACSGKKEGGGSGGSRSSGKETPASDFSYDLSKDGQGIIIKGYTGKGGAVVIPAKIEGIPVVGITDGAFAGGYKRDGTTPEPDKPGNAITSIVVPSSVVDVDVDAVPFSAYSAFYGMAELTRATLPDGIKVIPYGLFGSCKKLTTVNLPASLEKIEEQAFVNCGELNNLIIPDSKMVPGTVYTFVECEKVFSYPVFGRVTQLRGVL
jgi:hypothetical protein